MPWTQHVLTLRPRGRGCHLVTDEVLAALSELASIRVGLLHLFLMHTSASLTINENADATVRLDLETGLNRLAPENVPYQHNTEGPDDMPAHIKAALVGTELTIPISAGHPVLGTWQGIYLCEHRDHATARRVVATICGE
jgi:secondary thiamine-phosphate synthase enzyme